MTEYLKLRIVMRITISNITDVEVVVDKQKRKMQKGDINIIFDAWIITDYEKRWQQKAWYWLLRGFFEKFFFKVQTNKHIGEVSDDVHYVHDNVNSYLNLHKFIVKNNK